MGQLSEWAKKNSKFISLADGESIEASYEGFKITADARDPEKEKVIYRLGVLQDGVRVVKAFETASGKVARFFDEVKTGTLVKITRHGMDTKTSYDLEELNSDRKAAAKEEEDISFLDEPTPPIVSPFKGSA